MSIDDKDVDDGDVVTLTGIAIFTSTDELELEVKLGDLC